MKIRIKFRKWGVMRFVGHLDIMRYFQKALRRADIDVAYSAGYSPHPIMSFAAPLGVGLTSDGEYMDIEVNSTDSSEKSIRRLNAVMADGMEVTSYRLLPDDAKNAMSIVAAADYAVSFAAPIRDYLRCLAQYTICWSGCGEFDILRHFRDITEELNSVETLPVIKKTKKGEAEIDLRPFIYELYAWDEVFYMRLATGSVVNIKPMLVLEQLMRAAERKYGSMYCGKAKFTEMLEKKPYAVCIKRLEVYADIGTEEQRHLVPLAELGEDIG